ncbi:kinase-like protein [Calocera cornea HHB12733]|uniref:Kinase-like protein n=1 Tax=Calocera cornea HHB12733 TaxID=1353952 RepID=A0A165CXU3_9BASI|nr:kinase-like protein [Calocera cornea HHB12733]
MLEAIIESSFNTIFRLFAYLVMCYHAVDKRLSRTSTRSCVSSPKHELGPYTTFEGRSGGTQCVYFGRSQRKYDEGLSYYVKFSDNNDPSSLESILARCDWPASLAALEDAFVDHFGIRWWKHGEGIIPDATYNISTADGPCTITISPPLPKAPGVSIDKCLGRMPRIQISDLVRIEHINRGVDMVYLEDALYAFKHFEPTLDQAMDPLKEVKTAFELRQAPYIINVTALVTDGDSYRGFLMPYATVQSLVDAFRLRSYPWTTCVQIAYDIVCGVLALHRIQKPNGDLKPQNVILRYVGKLEDRPRAQLIDLEAHGGVTLPFTDPALAHETQPSTLQDIYSLGLMLQWLAIADELRSKNNLEMEPQEDGHEVELPTTLPPHVPSWYDNVIRRCCGPPSQRPTVEEVQHIFKKNM